MKKIKTNRPKFMLFIVISIFIWLIVSISAVVYVYNDITRDFIKTSKIISNTGLNMNLIFNMWNNSHTRVYVPITEKTQPNPNFAYLDYRDVKTIDGQKLTLLDSDTMIEQALLLGTIHNIETYGHIIDRKSSRKARQPDLWEKKTLEIFEKEEGQLFGFEKIGNKDYVRGMIHFGNNKCTKCHEEKGYEGGRLGEAFSVSIPIKNLIDAQENQKQSLLYIGIFAILLSVVLMVLAGYKINSQIKENEQMHVELRKMSLLSQEQAITGGFAHEMRNALAGGAMLLENALGLDEDKPVSIPKQTMEYLKDISQKNREQEIEKSTLGLFNKINSNLVLLDESLEQANSNVQKGLHITNMIMDYSKLSKIQSGTDTVNLSDLIKDIFQQNQSRLTQHKIDTKLNLNDDASLYGRHTHFHLLFSKIIENAIDALTDKGRSLGHSMIKINSKIKGENVVVEVVDNGIGLPKGLKEDEDIFQPFISTKPLEGMGLGLSIVTKYVSLYEGEINASSKEGLTYFTVTLPLKKG